MKSASAGPWVSGNPGILMIPFCSFAGEAFRCASLICGSVASIHLTTEYVIVSFRQRRSSDPEAQT